MARKRAIYLSVLNLTLHQHSAERYVQLLRFIRRHQIKSKYHGDRHAIIGFLGRPNENGDFVRGQIFSFIELDVAEQWLNTETSKPAENEELDSINIPEHLKPGMRIFSFIFFPKKHRLVFETRSSEGKSLGPESARKLFEIFLKAPKVIKEFGAGEVTIEPRKDALDKVLGIPKLKQLSIFITRPNPDDNESIEAIVKERMSNQNLQSFEEQLKAESGQSINPDEHTKNLASVAESNGYVEGKGKDGDGNPIDESTRDHPLRERAEYDPDTQTAFGVILEKAREIMRSIGRR